MDVKEANIKFHDGASADYDRKWAIRFDDDISKFVLDKFEMAFQGSFPKDVRVMEIGCGTGFVILNLGIAGVLDEAWGCDISQGMLDTCQINADAQGFKVHLQQADVENLPYEDEAFDVVLGHAVLHHLPDLNQAMAEILRVLKPGGACAVAGEPTHWGQKIASFFKRSASAGVKVYARFGGRLGGKPIKLRNYPAIVSAEDDHEMWELEHQVDIHNFRPRELCDLARKAGFQEVRFETEELVSSALGWCIRTIEGMVDEENITDRWRWGAYHAYQRARRIDAIMYRFWPRESFYNMIIYMRK